MPKREEEQAPVEELLARRDVARILRCSERTVISYEARGFLKPIRIGGFVRFTPRALRELIGRQEKGWRR